MKQQIIGLGKDSVIYGLGSVFTRFIGVFTLPLFTSYLTPQEYGIMAMLAILTMVVQPLFGLGLSAAMGPLYFEEGNSETKSKTVWTAFSLTLLSAMLLTIVSWLFPSVIAELIKIPTEHEKLAALTLTSSALSIMTTAFSQRVQFEKQARMYVITTVFVALISISVSVITVVFLGWGVTGMVMGQLVASIVSFLTFSCTAMTTIKPIFSYSTAKRLLNLGIPLVPSFLFLFILMRANIYILEWHEGLDAVGLYSVGFSLGSAISIVTGAFTKAWYPFFISYINKQDQIEDLFGHIFTYYVFGIGFLCLLFFLFAKPVITVLTTAEFYDAYMIVGMVALAYFFQTLFNLFLPGVYFNKEIKYVSLIQATAVLLALPTNFFLVGHFGLAGAGMGLVISNFFMAVLMYGWNFMKRKSYPAINYQWSRVILVGFAFSILAIASFELPQVDVIQQTAIGILGLIIGVGVIFSHLTDKEKKFVFGWFENRK